MPDSFDSRGLQTKSLTELKDDLVANIRRIYGQDVNLEASTPDGQLLNILVQANRDIREVVEQIVGSMNPETATGVHLDYICSLVGVLRKRGSYSLVNVDVTTDRDIFLRGINSNTEDTYTVRDTNGNQWMLLEDSNLTTGSNVLRFRAENIGGVSAQPNSITTPVTVVLGITSITNSSVLISQGTDEESDLALRVRRQRSLSRSSGGFIEAMEAELLSLPNVTDALVCENTESTEVGGIPPHGIWVIVDGSELDGNIGNAIYSHKSAGTPMRGDISINVVQPGRTDPVNVKWDAAIQENVWIKFISSRADGKDPDHAALRTVIANNLNAEIGQSLTQFKLICDIIKDENVIVEEALFFDRKQYRWTDSRTLSTPPRDGYYFSYEVGGSTVNINFDGDDSVDDIIAAFKAGSGLSQATVNVTKAANNNSFSEITVVVPDSVSLESRILYNGDIDRSLNLPVVVGDFGVSGGLVTSTSYRARDKRSRLVTSRDRITALSPPEITSVTGDLNPGSLPNTTVFRVVFSASNITKGSQYYLSFERALNEWHTAPYSFLIPDNPSKSEIRTLVFQGADEITKAVLHIYDEFGETISQGFDVDQ